MLHFILLLIFIVLSIATYYWTFKILWLKTPPYTPEGGSHFCEINHLKIHYSKNGPEGATPLLLVHGIAANIYCWRKLTPLITKKYLVYSIDLAGFGQSDKPKNEEQYSLQGQAQIVAGFIQEIIKQPTVLVGNSMGANISLQTYLTKPDLVSHLVLINVPYDPRVAWFDPRKIRFLMPLFYWLANPFFAKLLIKPIYGTKIDISTPTVQAYLRPYLVNKKNHYSVVYAFSALVEQDLKNLLKNIYCPTLIIWGRKDRVIPVSYSQKINHEIKNSKLVIHDTAGHHLQEEEPEWLSTQIQTFISG